MGPLAKSWRSNWPVLEQNGALAWALQPTEYPLHYSNLVPNEFDLLLPARCFDWTLELSYLKRKLKASATRDTHIFPQDFTLSLSSKHHICFVHLCFYTLWCFVWIFQTLTGTDESLWVVWVIIIQLIWRCPRQTNKHPIHCSYNWTPIR